ncbi:MAG: putative Ig domain-containing protein [Myxococcales bacterium]
MQVDLHERSGAIVIYYGAISRSSADTADATIGIENAAGTGGLTALACSPSCRGADWPEGQYVVISPAIDPDLFVLNVGSSALTPVTIGGQPGFAFDLMVTVKNQGQNPATGFLFDIYLSNDAIIDPANDTLLARHTTPESLPGRSEATFTESGVQFVRPPGTGNFYIGVVVDPTDVVDEAIETNNTGVSAPYMIGVELSGDISGPSAGGPGDVVDLRVIIRNQGTDPLDPTGFSFDVYLSPDPNLDRSSDTKFPGFPRRIDSLGGGETLDMIVPAALPAVPDGPYYYILDIDPPTAQLPRGEVTEAVETNNSKASSATVTLSAADLVVENIQVLSPVPPHEPTTHAYFGEQVRVTFDVRNSGGANATDFFISVVLSDNAVITTHDLDMSAGVPELSGLTFSGDQEQTFAVNITVPATRPNGSPFRDGTYYIGVILDPSNRVGESNETNNLNRAENEIFIRQPAMDVTPVRVEAPAAAAAGERMPIFHVIRNIGNRGSDTVGPAKYRFVLSSNDIISVEDIPLPILADGTLTLDGELSIGVGEEKVATDLVQIPSDVSPGTYHVGLVVDPLQEILELDEANNTIGSLGVVEIAPSSLYIVTSTLPDAMVGAEYLQQLVAVGGYGSYAWSVEPGQGDLPAGLQLSETGVLSGKPAEQGVSVFTVRVTSGQRSVLARMVLRTVPASGALGILSSLLPSAVKGINYSVDLVAVGGVRPYTWAIEQGELPLGLALSPEGTIAGKLAKSYTELVTLRVSLTDQHGSRTAADISMRAVEPGALHIGTVKLAEAMTGVSYVQQLQPMDASLVWKIRSGSLPDGLKLANGAITGVPAEVGLFPLRLEVSDAEGRSDSADFILTVLSRPASFTPVAIPEARPGESYFLDLSAAAKPHSSFVLYSGMLPPGLMLNVAGRVTGSVSADAAPGSYDFVVQITEETGPVLLVPLTIRVLPKPVPIDAESGGCSTGGPGLVPVALVLALLAPLALRRRRTGWRAVLGIAAAVAISLPSQAFARYDLTSYAQVPFSPIVGTPLDIPSASSQTTVTLPFPFRFWNTTYNALNIGCRGYIAFGSGNASIATSYGIPSTAASFPLIAPWWGKWDCNPGAVVYEVSGVAPHRVITFQWTNVWYEPDSTAKSLHGATFQARLYETTGTIDFAYGPSNHGLFADPSAIKAAVGIQANATLGMAGRPCTAAQPSGGGSQANCQPQDYEPNTILSFRQPPDLTMVRFYAEETGFAGVPMRMGASLENVGGQDVGGIAVRFYLSADDRLDTSVDAELGTSRQITLAVNQRRDVVIAPTLPLALDSGEYYLFAKIDPDGRINEDNENNNVGPASGHKFRLGGPTPDLIPGPLSVPATARAGEAISVSRSIHNIGNSFAGPCASDSQCDGLVCNSGRCRSQCTEPSDCAEGFICKLAEGICEPETCQGDQDCPASERCIAGACKNPAIRYALFLSDNPVISLADIALIGDAGLELSEGIGAFEANTEEVEVTLPNPLPPGDYYVGMVIDPEGTLSEITDVNNATTSAAKITIVSDELQFITSDLPDAYVQSPYGVHLEAAGGSGSYGFTLVSGSLPPGLRLSLAGDITGVASRELPEPAVFEVEVASAGQTARATFSIQVNPSDVPLRVITEDLPAAEFGRPYSVRLSAVGGRAPYTWSLSEGALLPPGLVLAPDGVIEGVPTLDKPAEEPHFSFQVEVRDGEGTTAAKPLSLKVVSPERLQISTSKLPDAELGKPYNFSLYVAGGRPPYVWNIVEARLLPSNPMENVDREAQIGLKLITDKTGTRLSGIPNVAGTWVITLKVLDTSGAEDNATFSLAVRYEEGIEIETQGLPDAIVGKTYYARLLARGGEADDISWSVICMPVLNDKGELASCRDGLPAGFTLSEDGIISTTEPVVGPEADEQGHRAPRTVYSFLVEARDEKNRSAVRGLSVTIRIDEPLYAPPSEGCGCGSVGVGAPPTVLLALAGVLGLLRRRRS